MRSLPGCIPTTALPPRSSSCCKPVYHQVGLKGTNEAENPFQSVSQSANIATYWREADLALSFPLYTHTGCSSHPGLLGVIPEMLN